jgi:hypothetical protein
MYNGKLVNETTIDLARKPSPALKDPAALKKLVESMTQFTTDFTADNQPATDAELQHALDTFLSEQEAAAGLPAKDKTDEGTSSRGPAKAAPSGGSNTSSAVDALDSAVDDLLNLLA